MNIALVNLLLSIVDTFITDVLMDKNDKLLSKIKKKRFAKKLHSDIKIFIKKNQNTFINSDTFLEFIKQCNFLNKVMQNALAMERTEPIEELMISFVDKAEKYASNNQAIITINDREILEEFCCLIDRDINDFFRKSLSDSEKYSTTQTLNAIKQFNTRIDKLEDNNNKNKSDLVIELKSINHLSNGIAEKLAKSICNKIWYGEFDDERELLSAISGKSTDLENVGEILNSIFFSDDRNINEVRYLISQIKDLIIRETIIRNILPILYWRNIDVSGYDQLVCSNNLKIIINSLIGDDLSSLFTELIETECGFEIHNYTFNKDLKLSEEPLVKRIFVIYLSKKKFINNENAIDEELGTTNSLLLELIQIASKISSSSNKKLEDVKQEFDLEFEKLLSKKTVYERLSNDLKNQYYICLIKVSVICNNKFLEVYSMIPEGTRHLPEIRSCYYLHLINAETVKFEELYCYCSEEKEYSLLVEYLANHCNAEKAIDNIKKHKELLESVPAIFFLYNDALTSLGKKDEVQTSLAKYKDKYSDYYEYWDIYRRNDSSTYSNSEFFAKCKEYTFKYLTLHSFDLMMNTLLFYKQYEIAENYLNAIKKINYDPVKLKYYQASIFYGNQKYIDALKLYKEIFEKDKSNLSVTRAIIRISLITNRDIEDKYIQTAINSKKCDMLCLAAQAYYTKNDFVSARKYNKQALFLSDNQDNPAFFQFIQFKFSEETKVEKISKINVETSIVLEECNNQTQIIYCIHDEQVLPECPYIWHSDVQIYFDYAASLGLLNRTIGEIIQIKNIDYKIIEITPLQTYISRVCFEKCVMNGSLTSIPIPVDHGEMNVSSFVEQIKHFLPESKKIDDLMQQYSNFDDVPLPLHMIYKFTAASYTQFVEMILEDQKYCVREFENEQTANTNDFILSYTSLLILKKIQFPIEILKNSNVYITDSTLIKIKEDTTNIINHYKRNEVSYLGKYNNKIFTSTDDELTKNRWIKWAGELVNYANNIKKTTNYSDWESNKYNSLNMTEILGIPDYDAISVSVREGYTLVGTEAMLTTFSEAEDIKIQVISLTNWMITQKIDCDQLIHFIHQMIKNGCIFSVTNAFVVYLSGCVKNSDEKCRNDLLQSWNLLLIEFDNLDEKYKMVAASSLRNVYISTYGELGNDPIEQILLSHLLKLFKLKISIQLDEKGEFQVKFIKE